MHIEKERCTPMYMSCIQWAPRGKSTKEKQKTTLSLSLSLFLNMILTNLQNRSKAFSLPLCTSQPKLTYYLAQPFQLILRLLLISKHFAISLLLQRPKMHSGVACQTFFHFLPTKWSWKFKRVSLIVEGSAQTPPNREKQQLPIEPLTWCNEDGCDRLILLQFYMDNKCSLVSSSSLKLI